MSTMAEAIRSENSDGTTIWQTIFTARSLRIRAGLNEITDFTAWFTIFGKSRRA